MDTATVDVPVSLREHIEAESVPTTPLTTPAAPAAAVTPEQEADSHRPDADLSEAAKTLRRSRAETRLAKVKAENDELARELFRRKELRSESERLASVQTPTPEERGSGGRTPEHTTGGGDPEPDQDTFEDYNQYLTAHARWAARDEIRTQQTQIRDAELQQARTARLSEQAATLDAIDAKGVEAYGDFRIVADTVIEAVAGNPRAHAISAFLASSQAGHELVYRLGKQPDILKAVTEAPTVVELSRALTRLEHEILTPRVASSPITKAPLPPVHTVGGSASPALLDTRKGVPLKDHIQIEEAELAERRRAGYRY